MSKNHKHKVITLYNRQDGLCIYCGCECRIYDPLYHDFTYTAQPKDMATLEHLFDAFDIRRRIPDYKFLVPLHVWAAMSCYECNCIRGYERGEEMNPKDKPTYYDIRDFLTPGQEAETHGTDSAT